MFDDRKMGELEAVAKLHAMPPSVPVSTEVAAMFLGYSVSSLENMRRDGTGPAYIQPPGEGSKKVKYQIGVLLAWLEKNTVGSITEAAIRDGKLFATLGSALDLRPFWIAPDGRIGGLVDESTVAQAKERIETHDVVWLSAIEALSKRDAFEQPMPAVMPAKLAGQSMDDYLAYIRKKIDFLSQLHAELEHVDLLGETREATKDIRERGF
jgi:hypothetical protein